MKPSTSNLGFRPDIQGLRAIAVLSVLLYHFAIPGTSGGFAGVDVFFTISGFLMAATILPALKAGSFSFRQFYFGRLRRIFPALAALCLPLAVLGWFWLGPTDYTRLAEHIAGSLTFVSNFLYRMEDGYFAAPSHDIWLLHTWSLSVEAQFYLLFPLLLVATARYRSRLLVGLSLLSFVIALATVKEHGPFTFYLLPARLWELLAGALVYLHSPRLSQRQSRSLHYAGLAIILASVALITEKMLWPSWATLFPVLGSLCILAAAHEHSWLSKNSAPQAIGRWSYSIYLWHWPLSVGLAYFGLAEQHGWIAGGIAASLLLGMLSYRYIEQPCRQWSRPRLLKPMGSLVLASIALLALLSWGKGFPERMPENVRIANEAFNNQTTFKGCGFDTRRKKLTPCIMGNPDDIGYVLLGDSHAVAVATAMRDAVAPRGVAVLSHYCGTLFDTEIYTKAKNHCRAFNRAAMDYIRSLPTETKVVVINRYAVNLKGPNEGNTHKWGFVYYDEKGKKLRPADRDALYRQRLTASLCAIKNEHPLYVIKPTPEFGYSIPRRQIRRLIVDPNAPDLTMAYSQHLERHRLDLDALNEASTRCALTLLDPIPYYCDATTCKATLNQQPLYFDDNHLSEFGNRLLLPMFQKAFGK